jgi:Family of unknown function (DUF6455)
MSDFCYSRPMLNRILQQAELMDFMMERLGIDPVVAARLENGMAWYDARSQCIACHSERQCQEWVKRAPTEPSIGPPDFCHNTAFFRCCAVSVPERSAPQSLSHDGGAQ